MSNEIILFQKYAEPTRDVLQRSITLIQRYGHEQIDIEHILFALLEQLTIVQIVKKLNRHYRQ